MNAEFMSMIYVAVCVARVRFCSEAKHRFCGRLFLITFATG